MQKSTIVLQRECVIRTKILDQLKLSVQSILHGEDGILHVSSGSAQGPVIGHTDNTNMLCSIFEAILIHGLKDRLGEKLASLFSSDLERMPVPNFWPVIMTISHKDLMQQVLKLTFITSDVGRSRSWMRLALNQGQLMSYISLLASDAQTLKDYYRQTAFIRDTEMCDIMIRCVQPLSCISFNIATNAAVLNTWTQTPLIIAGVWTPTRRDYLIDPVLAATDVASTLHTSSPAPVIQDEREADNLTEEMFNVIIRGTPEIHLEEYCSESPDNTLTLPDSIKQSKSDKDLVQKEHRPEIQIVFNNYQPEIVDSLYVQPGDSFQEQSFNSSVFMRMDSIMNRSVSTVIDDTEYVHLFSELQVSHNSENLPSYLQFRPVNRTQSVSEQIPEEEKGFEMLPANISMEDLIGSEVLYPLLTVITNEEGLLSQNYLCHRDGCSNHVGLIYGKPRLCSYESRYYCYECHKGDLTIIPARIVRNWDFSLYSVCSSCKSWIEAVLILPVINLRVINPKIYRYIEELAEVQILRIQLYYIQAYLFTCKIDKGTKLRRDFWPGEHIYEHVNIYSAQDLVEVNNGKLLPKIRQNICEGKKHILNCDRCSPRGFICEICKQKEVIYPFNLPDTYTCPNCSGVYHKQCIEIPEDCTKCKRREIQETKDKVDDVIN